MRCCPWLKLLAVLFSGAALWNSTHALVVPVDNLGDSSWYMFGGTPRRNQVNTVDKNIPITWSVEPGAEKNIKWTARVGRLGFGAPTVAAGKVFMGTNNDHPRNLSVKGDKGVLMCFRATDGAFLWQALHDKLEDRSTDWPHQGIASSPALEGKRLYYVNNRCELICADTEGFLDGKNDGVQDELYKSSIDADIIWRLDMRGSLGVHPRYLANCSPLVSGNLVFVVTGNGTNDEGKVVNPEAPSFLAVAKNTGQVVWKSNLPGADIMEGQWSSPALATVDGQPQVIFPGGDGWLYGFEAATGNLVWKFNANPRNATYGRDGTGAKCYFMGTPVVAGDYCYIATGRNPEQGPGPAYVWCIDLRKKGEMVWRFGGPRPNAGEGGRTEWFGRSMSTCAVHDGLLYIAELHGYASCLDAVTGQLYWQHDLKSECWGSPLWVDGKIYVPTGDGVVQVFQHGKELKILSEIDMGAAMYAPPVVAGGTLYIPTKGRLIAIARQ
ncbi:MAG: PQQ-binding-like beta-propeller repeat protein [Gemmataceae bacterium]